jgi:DHA1 family multidrug resistance protein-like MFS transporter
MLDIIRDAPAGEFLRWVTKNRILLYPDEKEGFVLPRLVRLSQHTIMAIEVTKVSAGIWRPVEEGCFRT